MASKNITITESAYEHLRAVKRDDESFSDVIDRLTAAEDPMLFAGTVPGIGDVTEDARGELEQDLEDVQDELFGQ